MKPKLLELELLLLYSGMYCIELNSIDGVELKFTESNVIRLNDTLYSRNIKLSLPRLKQHYKCNLLGNKYHNADQNIDVEITTESFDETFWGQRNSRTVFFTKPLMAAIHFLPELIEKMILTSKTKDIKPLHKKKGGIEILRFEVTVECSGKFHAITIPVLKMKEGKHIQYSIKIK